MTNNQVYYTNGGGDEQYTPRKTVEILLPYIQHLKDKIIWCPFDKEDSQFIQVLKENGFNVVYSHIEYGQDFFDYEPCDDGYYQRAYSMERCPFCGQKLNWD